MNEVPQVLQRRYQEACYKKIVMRVRGSWQQALQCEADFEEVRRELYQAVGWWRAFKFEFNLCFAGVTGYLLVFLLGILTHMTFAG